MLRFGRTICGLALLEDAAGLALTLGAVRRDGITSESDRDGSSSDGAATDSTLQRRIPRVELDPTSGAATLRAFDFPRQDFEPPSSSRLIGHRRAAAATAAPAMSKVARLQDC